jgi:hypothetical protein
LATPLRLIRAASDRPPADETMREVEPLNITDKGPLVYEAGKNGEAGRAPQRSKPGLVSGVRDSPEW